MDWTKGYAARWRVDRIDPGTWEACGILGGIEKVTVERDGTDEAPLLETMSIDAVFGALDVFTPGWYRVVMEATQGLTSESVPVATLWLDRSDGKYNKGYREDKLTGRSVLHQASDTPAGDGAYAPKGADGAAWAANALRGCIDAPVNVSGGFELTDHVVFDLDASVLQAVWEVLAAGGWRIRIDGRGEVYIEPMPTEPALVLDRPGSCVLQPEVKHDGAKRTYKREYAPDIVPYDLVYGAMPERGLDGTYRIQTQKLTCAKGIVVEESVVSV